MDRELTPPIDVPGGVRARALAAAVGAARRCPALITHAGALAVALLVLVSAGQPLFTEDTWWHLSMGEAYLGQGPWLDADPLLYAATGPPAPAAWLFDVALHGVELAAGFQGLRVVHALLVACILALAWSGLRRASGSAGFASLGTAVFVVLSAYRLFQLRPHLFTILATLILVRVLILDGRPPTRGRIAAAGLVLGLWANAHAGFVLGPVVLGAAVAGLAFATLLGELTGAPDRTRLRGLAAALAIGLLCTLVNPSGVEPHLLYFTAGGATPALDVVADEWAPFAAFALPLPNVPPSPLSWALAWGLLLLTPIAVVRSLRMALHFARGRSGEARVAGAPRGDLAEDSRFDPALAAAALVALVALLSAVRFLWLGIVPLLVLGQTARSLGWVGARAAPRPGGAIASASFAPFGRWAAALAGLSLVPAFLWLGDWPMISRGIHPAIYGRPYPAVKYYAHAVWFLRDARLEGRLWNDYGNGNFLGYWLAPRMQVFVNGSLNVPADLMPARRAIAGWEPTDDGVLPEELLDRYGVDVFFGTGLPGAPRAGRPIMSTTTNLEHTRGWILVFRNLRSAVYVRDDERNRANLERVAAYYSVQGVPFDLATGLDPERTIGEAPLWSVGHGLLPRDFRHVDAARRSLDPGVRRAAQHHLAGLYAILGLYDRAVSVCRSLLQTDPGSLRAGRILVWSLLHLRRYPESLAAAEALAAYAPEEDGLSAALVDSARRVREETPARAAGLIARLPAMGLLQAQRLLAGVPEPEARERDRRR